MQVLRRSLCVSALLAALVSCANLDERGNAVVGGAVGGAAGAAIGGELGGRDGAVIGAGAGGAAGAAVGQRSTPRVERERVIVIEKPRRGDYRNDDDDDDDDDDDRRRRHRRHRD